MNYVFKIRMLGLVLLLCFTPLASVLSNTDASTAVSTGVTAASTGVGIVTTIKNQSWKNFLQSKAALEDSKADFKTNVKIYKETPPLKTALNINKYIRYKGKKRKN